jgi:hypothetical protein
MVTCTDLLTLDVTYPTLDIQAFTRIFESNEKKFMQMIPARCEDRSLFIHLRGEVTGSIFCSKFTDKTTYSLGVTLNATDKSVLDTLCEEFSNIVKEDTPFGSDTYTLKNLVKDDRIYLKLKVGKNGKFSFFSDIKMNAEKIDEVELVRGQPVDLELGVSCYVNVREKTAGLVLDLLKLKTKNLK